MREAKQQRREVVLVRDRLYIDGEQYLPPEDRFLESEDNIINPTPPRESGKDEPSTRTNNVNNLGTPGRKPAKRSRVGSSPPQTNSPVAQECHGEHQNVEISNSFVIDTCNVTDVTVSHDMNENIENISVHSDNVVNTVNVNN